MPGSRGTKGYPRKTTQAAHITQAVDEVNMAETEKVLAQALGRLTTEGSRREFLRLAGLTGGAIAAMAITGCGDDDDEPTNPNNSTITLNFSQPVDVLKYAFALEALEADFYTRVVSNAGFNATFTSADERQILTDIRDHEVAHREFLRAAITAAGSTLPTLTVEYPASVNFGNRASVLATAKTFEDLGVGAYNGAGRYLVTRTDLLTIAGKIVSVEARHAAAIRDVLSPNTDQFANVTGLIGADETNGLDSKATPQQVLAAADPFITQTITVTNT